MVSAQGICIGIQVDGLTLGGRAGIFTSRLVGFLSDFFLQEQFEIFLIFLVSVNPYDASCDECVRTKSDTLNATSRYANAMSSGGIGGMCGEVFCRFRHLHELRKFLNSIWSITMKKIILSSLLAVAAAAPIASQAADGTITFNGNITSQTCTINGGTGDVTVTMPKISTSALNGAGQKAGTDLQSIKLNLTACSPATGAVRAFFEGGSTVNLTTHHLKNATGAGRATLVEVAVLNTDGSDVILGAGFGAQNVAYVPISAAGTAQLVYGSQYVATGVATQGTVNTTVQYSLDFQ